MNRPAVAKRPESDGAGDTAGRLLLGLVAGTAASVAMTAAMRRLFPELPAEEQYPLPPREILDRVEPAAPFPAERSLQTLLAHLGYGALTGALYAALPRRPSGFVYGPAIWALSYLGWLPGLRILKPAQHHPAKRNLLMLAVHLVWGGTLAWSLRELEASMKDVFAAGHDRDHP